MSYTKRNISIISLLFTILAFICLFLINFQVFSLINFKYYNTSKTIYSKTIPIEKQNEEIKTISTLDNIENNLIGYENKEIRKISLLEQEMFEAYNKQNEYITQSQIIQANELSSWRIKIPKLGLNVHIEEGTTADVLLRAVGHFENTATWNGNICLAGHNRGYLCNFFQKIKNLNIGDEIIYCSKQGERIYKVQTNKVILETDWTYIKETKDDRITLITCEENRQKYRRCVQAVLVAEDLINN